MVVQGARYTVSLVLEQSVSWISELPPFRASMALQHIYFKRLQIISGISVSVVRSFQEELLAAGFEVALPELIRVQRQTRGAKDWDLFLHGPKMS